MTSSHQRLCCYRHPLGGDSADSTVLLGFFFRVLLYQLPVPPPSRSAQPGILNLLRPQQGLQQGPQVGIASLAGAMAGSQPAAAAQPSAPSAPAGLSKAEAAAVEGKKQPAGTCMLCCTLSIIRYLDHASECVHFISHAAMSFPFFCICEVVCSTDVHRIVVCLICISGHRKPLTPLSCTLSEGDLAAWKQGIMKYLEQAPVAADRLVLHFLAAACDPRDAVSRLGDEALRRRCDCIMYCSSAIAALSFAARGPHLTMAIYLLAHLIIQKMSLSPC